jgi:RHS repeat-associated protein
MGAGDSSPPPIPAPSITTTTTQTCSGGTYTTYSNFIWTAPDGTQRLFYLTTQKDVSCGVQNISTGSAYAQDSSGYYISVSNYTTAEVFANDGTIVSDGTQTAYTVKDANGNYFSESGSNVVDTLGRIPVTTTQNGSQIYYDALNSQGSTSRFTATTEVINVDTNFGASGVNEYSGTLTVLQSLSLPDGTSYQFTYDQGTTPGYYGLLATVTIPTGGEVSYGFGNFTDALGNVRRWLESRTEGSGTWQYTPSLPGTCPTGTPSPCQQVTLAKPDGNDAVYTFSLNNGAWNTETDIYNGSPSGTLLHSSLTSYDFSNSCPGSGCTGAAFIRPIKVISAEPSAGATLYRKVQYSYDSIYYGNVTAIKEWAYYTGTPSSTPDRETDLTYLSTSNYIAKNILNRATDRQVKNRAGTKVAETLSSYDSTTLTSIAGVIQHDDTGYGGSDTVRGNATQTQDWVSGSTYLSTSTSYDTTGQPLQVTDAAGNSTSYSYGDNFYMDNGSNPPQAYTPPAPTNAYVTQTTLPVSGSLKSGYYFATGKLALSTEQNGNTTYQHYLDSLDRPTHTYIPAGGWQLTTYPASTEISTYTGLTDATPSPSCTGCRSDQVTLDSLGRVSESTLVSDPEGATNVDTAYDSTGRVQSTSNPYRSTSDPTYGLETPAYDGLGRVTTVTHADSNSSSAYYGSAVTGAGGAGSQLCSSSTYGIGYPQLTIDEAANKAQTWTDGFGRLIEADEPDSTGALTIGTCYKYDALGNLTEVDQGSQTRTYAYDGLSRTTSETTPEAGTVNYYFTTSSSGLCAGSSGALCRKTDARGITSTYAYDAENRLTSKTYSDSTPAAHYYYDEASVTVGGTPYAITNGKGRLTHTSAASGNAVTVHSYDSAGRPQDLWQCTPYNCSNSSIWNVHYTYDEAGDVTSWQHPAGYTFTNTISTAQRITQITSSASDSTHPGTLLGNVHYAPQGAVANAQNGCVGTGCVQTQESYDYNNRLQPVRIQVGSSSTPAADSCTVHNYYQGAANPASCAIPSPSGSGNNGNLAGHYYQDGVNASFGHTAAFTYDHLNRLTASVATPLQQGGSAHNLAFSYDRYGNMTCVLNGQTNGPCPQWGYSASSNRLTNSGFTYDTSGDLTADGSHTYQWDAEGRLRSVDSGSTATYTYNALGQRVEKKVGSTYTELAYDASGEPVGENNRSVWPATYISFNGRHLANYQNSATYFSHGGSLGTTGMVTDYAGNVAQDELHYPWGQQWSMSGTQQEERFARFRRRDAETNFDPTHFRMYTANQGRWLIPDPGSKGSAGLVSPQSFNRYAYVGNNPIVLTDPVGLCGEPDQWDPSTNTLTGSYPCNVGGGGAGGGGGTILCALLGGACGGVGGGAGGGAGWGGTTTFSQAQGAFLNAAKSLAKNSFSKSKCQADFKALDVSTTQVQQGCSKAVFLNGIGSNVTMASLYATSPNAGVRQAGKSQKGTVGSFIAANPGTVAVSQLGGPDIYLNASLISPTDFYQNEGVVLHEVLHNVTGLTDPDIQGDLGLPEAASNNITQRLIGDCF